MTVNSFKIESSLNVKFKNEVEELLFFNTSQNIFSKQITSSIDTYGLPEIIEMDNSIKIRLNSKIETHSLFLTSEINDKKKIMGIALVIKGGKDEAILLHVVMGKNVMPDYVLLNFMTKIRNYLSGFKQIKWLRIFYIDRIVKLRV